MVKRNVFILSLRNHINKSSHMTSHLVTFLITCPMMQSLKFKVNGSKTVVVIVGILKSNHFESKYKQMKWSPNRMVTSHLLCTYKIKVFKGVSII